MSGTFRPGRLLLLAPFLAAHAAFAADEAPKGDPAGEYIRFVPQGKDAGRLETAIASFESEKGVEVHLVAAIHVADRAYYEELGRLFDGYDALLYELVRSKEALPDPKEKSPGLVSAFQRALKDLLALEFQLDGIDYTKKNFIHADMDAETFEKMQRERGENLFTLMLRAVLDDLRRQSEGKGTADLNPFELLRALFSRDRARSLKLLLARELKDIEARLASFEGPKGSVILTERNKVAVEALKKTIEDGKKEIGIFYGGAHMPDIERRLVSELGFKKRATRWLVAWDMPPVKAESPEKDPEKKSRREEL